MPIQYVKGRNGDIVCYWNNSRRLHKPNTIPLELERGFVSKTSLAINNSESGVSLWRDKQMSSIFVIAHACGSRLASDDRCYFGISLTELHCVLWICFRWLFSRFRLLIYFCGSVEYGVLSYSSISVIWWAVCETITKDRYHVVLMDVGSWQMAIGN